MTRREALNAVASALEAGEPRHFQVAIVGYFLDGRPYPADGLAVNSTNTPNFTLTSDGFTCDGFFAPHMLDAEHVGREGQGPASVVRVRISVNERDVWAIAEFTTDRQINLFVDPGVMRARKFAFAKESADWRESVSERMR